MVDQIKTYVNQTLNIWFLPILTCLTCCTNDRIEKSSFSFIPLSPWPGKSRANTRICLGRNLNKDMKYSFDTPKPWINRRVGLSLETGPRSIYVTDSVGVSSTLFLDIPKINIMNLEEI